MLSILARASAAPSCRRGVRHPKADEKRLTDAAMAVSQPPGLGFGGSWSSFGAQSGDETPTTPALPPPPPGADPPSLESLRRQLDHPAPAPSVVGPPARQRSYGTLGERLGEGLRPPIGWNSSVASDAVFEPPERPSTAPVDDRARARDQQNVALLISSMQELTAVVEGDQARLTLDALAPSEPVVCPCCWAGFALAHPRR